MAEKGKGTLSEGITYKVNGESFKTTKESLTVREILENAGLKAGIDLQKISEYYLTDLETSVKYNDLDQTVQLREGIQFTATYKGKTPVA